MLKEERVIYDRAKFYFDHAIGESDAVGKLNFRAARLFGMAAGIALLLDNDEFYEDILEEYRKRLRETRTTQGNK